MPICILLVPKVTSQEAKLALMGRLSIHIHEAYPVTTTHIFVHEACGSNMMLAGSLVSELPTTDTGPSRACLFSDLPYWLERRSQEDDDGEAHR